jgi:broad-specificity NMP kinase
VTDNIAVTLKNIEGRIYLNDQMEVMGEVEQIDVDFDFGDSFVENLTEAAVAIVKSWIIDMIKSHIHAIVLCPKVVDINIESLGYHALIAPEELITTDNEVRIALNLDIKELQKNTTPQPGFIANTHTKEVHRIYCDELDEMNEINKVGYFVLKDALNDGYDTCGKCIPWYSKR